MWDSRYLTRIDFRVIPIILALMCISLCVISSYTLDPNDNGENSFLTPLVCQQIQWFVLGSIVYVLCAGFDYNKLREWTWILYTFMILSLIGLFFTETIQQVHRWYKIPFLNVSFQPSESAKFIAIIALSWFLERKYSTCSTWNTAWIASVIIGIPFLLILKQPDLGSALVLFPIALVMFYFGGIRSSVIKGMSFVGSLLLIIIAFIFLGIVPHETIKPYATLVLKEYQFDRLDPSTHHQKSAAVAIALGGISGQGWHQSEFSGRGWLPAPYTDSVFPAFGEEFGFIGLFFLMFLYYMLIYCCFQVAVVAKDLFGRLLAAGVSVYIAMHILVNIGMMCGFLPITGVPLILVTYGGSSVLSTMVALGVLQSIYSRRFMF